MSQAITTVSPKTNTVNSSLLKGKILLAIFGVVLPLVALVVELQLRVIARGYFDPFPSTGHALLFALIPLSNALVLISMSHIRNEHYAFLTLLNGMAAGIASTYAVMFIPLIPVSLLWVFALGIGLLGLAPLISIFTTHHAGRIICELARKGAVNFEPDNAKHLGHLLVIATIIAVELPSTLTRIHLGMYCDPSNPTASNDLNWLRANGNQDVLLRACYERSGKATDILGTLFEASHPPNLDRVREAFYKVTGKPFNSVPIPADARATMQHAQITIDGKSVQDEFDVDTDIAGESVSSISRGLTSANEAITGQIESASATANLHWTVEFINTSKYKREARAKVDLPPGAVVTKAIYWRDGRSYEAAIESRRSARGTYKRSLKLEDHPLLVSCCGPDQILMQCYPISPNSIIKIQLDLVAPLRIDSPQTGAIELPSFSEQNFGTDGKRTVVVEGATSTEHLSTSGSDNSTVLPGAIQIVDQQHEISVGSKTYQVAQKLEHIQNTVPKHTIIVIDGSDSLNQIKSELFEALKQIPTNLDSQIYVITDAVSSDAQHQIQPGFEGVNFIGGQDNSFFLYNKLVDVAQKEDIAVLWIHGSQPTAKKASEIKGLLLGADHPILYDLQVCSGPNEELDGMFWSPGLKRVPKFGSVKSDLQAFFSDWTQPGDRLVVSRSISEHESTSEETTSKDYDSLDALAVAEKINEDIRTADYVSNATRTDEFLAKTLHVVTPITSAIVSLPYERYRHYSNPNRFSLGRIAQSMHPLNLDIKKAFEACTVQLNNLSTAAATAGEFSTTELDKERLIESPHKGYFAGSTNGTVALSTDEARLGSGDDRSNAADQMAEETKPVPEPETLPMLLLVMGVLGIVLFVARRRRRAIADG